jgi:hypothetical protein
MGYRSDCEKCQLKVPGHYMHLLPWRKFMRFGGSHQTQVCFLSQLSVEFGAYGIWIGCGFREAHDWGEGWAIDGLSSVIPCRKQEQRYILSFSQLRDLTHH